MEWERDFERCSNGYRVCLSCRSYKTHPIVPPPNRHILCSQEPCRNPLHLQLTPRFKKELNRINPWFRWIYYLLVQPPPVIKHGNGKWTMEISNFPIKNSIQLGDFPANHVWLPEGNLMFRSFWLLNPHGKKHLGQSPWQLNHWSGHGGNDHGFTGAPGVRHLRHLVRDEGLKQQTHDCKLDD